jgi:hypothetical protein
MLKRQAMMLDCMLGLEKKKKKKKKNWDAEKRMSMEKQCNVHGKDQPRRLRPAHPS